MKKIISFFKRDYEGNRQVYDEVVSGAEWVTNGEGITTLKLDGTACMVRDGILYKRYDRKRKKGKIKAAPPNWEAAEPEPNEHTGHWPGWVPVDFSLPENKWHKEAWDWTPWTIIDGTYELVGPKVQGNPYNLGSHRLWRHGVVHIWEHDPPPREFQGLKDWFGRHGIEGLVWHHQDGRMVKIKRRDFGLPWPVEKE